MTKYKVIFTFGSL